MDTPTDLRVLLSRDLDSEKLDLKHDTVVVSPEAARRVVEAFRRRVEQAAAGESSRPVCG